MIRAAIGPGLREEWLPAQSRIECESGHSLPGVGNIGSEIPLVTGVNLERRLREREDIAGEEVGIAQPDNLSIEGGNAAAIEA